MSDTTKLLVESEDLMSLPLLGDINNISMVPIPPINCYLYSC